MKKYYDAWDIPWNQYYDEINLIINENNYIYETDENSMFYHGKEREVISIGQIIIELGNYLYIGREEFFKLFDAYKKIYTIPNVDFVKRCFSDLMNLGFCQLLAHAIVDFIIMHFKEKDTFENAYVRGLTSIEEWCNYPINSMLVSLIGDLDPTRIMRKDYQPFDSCFLTHIIEVDHELYSICTQLDLYALINLDALYSRKTGIKVLQCNHCRSFFIQSHGNNTKWCKKCSDIDFCKKTNDEFYLIYRKCQKTMLQRSYRNTLGSWEYQEKYTTPWEDDIKSVINEYREKNDLSGFKVYLKETMKKYKP
ncbi:MAG: hypothetical protein MSA09_10765 [Lachnospiraceae bacterium]|nr:hypothetical protein [Lachnospiraceae bacterium]